MSAGRYIEDVEFTDELVRRLQNRVGGNLRSVVVFTKSDYRVGYIRNDVKDRYGDGEIEEAVEEMRLETLHREYVNDVFERRCGELRCNITYFTESVEINFPVANGEGLAIAIDEAYFAKQKHVVDDVTELLQDYSIPPNSP